MFCYSRAFLGLFGMGLYEIYRLLVLDLILAVNKLTVY